MANENLPAETPLLKKLNEQRISAAHDRKELLERAADGTELSAEENAAFEKASRSIDHYGDLIKGEIERIQKDSDIASAYEAGIGRVNEARKRGDRRGEERTDGMAAKIREDLAASKRGETRNGGMYQELPEHRDLVSTTGAVGYFAGGGPETVPVTLVENLYSKLFDDSAVLGAGVTILRTASGETLKLPRLTSLAITAGTASTAFPQASTRVAEGGPILEAEPRFDQVQLDAYKYAQYTQVSRELVEDGVLDIEALLGQVLGRNMSNYVGYDLTLGTGTGQPRGVRTVIPAGNKVNSAAGGLFDTADFDKFFDVIAKLKPGYRRNAKWLVNDSSTFSLRKLKMGSVYAWEPNLQQAGAPDTFLGYPLLTDPNVPVPAASAGVTAIFGDFSAYYVRMVKDVRIEWSMEFAWVNDLLSVKAVMRADGDAIDDDAFAGFTSTA
jgi:HK97 family phage major capsid protein